MYVNNAHLDMHIYANTRKLINGGFGEEGPKLKPKEKLKIHNGDEPNKKETDFFIRVSFFLFFFP